MCGACRVSVGGEVRFACVDGPDFDGALVDFEELTNRQRVYVDAEREADAAYQRECACRTDAGDRVVSGPGSWTVAGEPLDPKAGNVERIAGRKPSREAAQPDARGPGHGARPGLRRGLVRLLRGDRPRRGRALPAVREPDLPGRVPGQHRHPGLRRVDHRRRLRPRHRGAQGAQRASRGLRSRVPAGGAVRGAAACSPARARPSRSAGSSGSWATATSRATWSGAASPRSAAPSGFRCAVDRFRPRRSRVRRRARAARPRGHGVRVAARRGRGARLRHPRVPPARAHRERGGLGAREHGRASS